MTTYGRIDYMPRLKVWRVIWYDAAKDIPVGDFASQKEATDHLQKAIRQWRQGTFIMSEAK